MDPSGHQPRLPVQRMATTSPGSGAAPAPAPAPAKAPPPLGRAVIWIGLALGTAITVLAVLHGIRFPGLQVVLSVALTWALLIVVAITVAELLRRHHRAAARHAWRHSKRGALFAGRHGKRAATAAGRRNRAGSGHLARKAAARWENREHRPLMFTRSRGPGPEPLPRYVTDGPAAKAAARPPAATPGAGTAPPEGKTTMADTKIVNDDAAGRQSGSRMRPARRAQHTAARAGGAMPAEWGAVIARAADFEPDDDGELLGWMGDEVSGVAGYAEALVDLYESCTAGIGLDPVAMTALHDVADAAAHAAETMSAARHRFADHYELPREFAGNGGLMPHDGRWVTGDGDA